jgi:hypothetical protein
MPPERVGERVRDMIARAERDAAAIRREADNDARDVRLYAERAAGEAIADAVRRADEAARERVARMHDLSEAIASYAAALAPPERAGDVLLMLDRLRAAIDAAATDLGCDLDPPAHAGTEVATPLQRKRFARAGAPRNGENTQESRARLVAQQMARAGGRRAEIEEHLRRAFGIPEPARIAEQVFTAVPAGSR